VLQGQKTLIPAYAGMTKARVDFQSTNSEPFGIKPMVIHFIRSGGRCAFAPAIDLGLES